MIFSINYWILKILKILDFHLFSICFTCRLPISGALCVILLPFSYISSNAYITHFLSDTLKYKIQANSNQFGSLLYKIIASLVHLFPKEICSFSQRLKITFIYKLHLRRWDDYDYEVRLHTIFKWHCLTLF